VVALDAADVPPPQLGDDLVRVRVVADDVAEADDLVDPQRVQPGERRPDRLDVRVKVRNDGDAQGR
jgi:hypothetical protein